jgi:hypothetical protein
VATLLRNGKVLIAGGLGTASAELYDPASRKRTLPADPLATVRYGPTATLLPDGKVLIAGGQNPRSHPDVLSTTELYDPEYNKDSPMR